MVITLFTLAIIDWMQFGLAGVTFATLSTMTMKILKLLKDKGQENSATIDKLHQEMLVEIEKRELRLIDLQEKTLKALYKVANTLEKVVIRLSDLEDKVGEEGTDEHN